MEIVPGIHRVDGIRGANSYLAVGESALIVIDTGMPGNGGKIADYLSKLGKKPGDVSYIVLTHSDIDHSGSAAELKALTGARLAVHAADAAGLSGAKSLKKPRGILAPLFGIVRKLIRLQPVKADIILKDGDTIGGYRVVHCPGHTAGSIALYRPGDLIFVGDALRSDSRGNPRLPSSLLSGDMAQALDSVKKISSLEFGILLPGHGAPVIKDASGRVKSLLGLNN